MRDLFDLVSVCATKTDIANLMQQVATHTEETNKKIAEANERIGQAIESGTKNTERIVQLETNIEILKQDQLKNNICISGIPCENLQTNNTADIVIAVARALEVDIPRNCFTSYPVARNKFIIVNMFNAKYKQTLLSKIRTKKSLMVEEVFKNASSNGQIYLNDHMTPYFNQLFSVARKAKKQGDLASVTSYGGKIRVRKQTDDAPVIINTEQQLSTLIGSTTGDTQINHMPNASSSNENTPHTLTSTSVSSQKTNHQKRPVNKQHTKNPKNYRPRTNHHHDTRASSANRDKQHQHFDANRELSDDTSNG